MYSKCLLFILFSLYLLHAAKASNDDQRKLYIVYMGELPEVRTNLMEDHNKLLMEAIGDAKMARQAKVYSYSRSLNGFAARLLPHEADKLSKNENVVSIFPSTEMHLHTTRSWDFLGMPVTVERNATAESDIIVGLLDTGIYVPSKSFSDAGYGPAPSKWKGTCQKGDNFTDHNNKVIGARYFDLEGKAPLGQVSPADFEGHGTHTASTVAGVPVEHASLYGIAEGTARGGVPQARIAMYKVCWPGFAGCNDANILAGFDAAIADGVDIISVSLGPDDPKDYFNDSLSIGSFHAVKKGIFVSAAAGNSGGISTVTNTAPWMLTVAASTIDRVINTPVELGNGKEFNGTAINLKETEIMQPLTVGDIDICVMGNETMKKEVQGKILFCKHGYEKCLINELGGSGIIDYTDSSLDTPFYTCEARTTVSTDNAKKIETYINSTGNAMAKIYKSRNGRTEEAPWIASFSSRGPDIISKTILKPDLAAPGDAILAAYSELTTLSELTEDDNDTQRVGYVILSGTSMACPHAASAIAYIKSFHPDWSPAALKSALMTTAKPMQKEQKGAELSSGSGNINPVGAVDPGLVYDMDTDYYISFLCKHGYNDTQVSGITGNKSTKCSDYSKQIGHDGLNYPSMHYQLMSPNDTDISAIFYRTVTHVADGLSEYKAMVVSPKGLSIYVEPETLYFLEKGQKASFKVMLKGNFLKKKQWYLSGSLTWSDSKHFVRSPVLVYRAQA